MSAWRPPQLIEIVKGLGPPKKPFKKLDRGVSVLEPYFEIWLGGAELFSQAFDKDAL